MGSRRNPRPWTEQDLSTLTAMRSTGARVGHIARALKRPVEAVFARCKILVRSGKLASKKPAKLSTDELSVLRDSSLRHSEAAKRIGRTVSAVRSKRSKMGVVIGAHKPWNNAEDRELIKLRAAGRSMQDIAGALGRTESSISSRVLTLINAGEIRALSREERAQRGADATAWSKAKVAALIEFRKTGRPVAEIAAALYMSPEAVYAKAKRLVRANVLPSAKPPRWTEDEMATLRDDALTNVEVARIIHRPVTAIRTKRVKLGLTRRAFWTAEQDQSLINLREKGASARSIANALGRTESAVSNRVGQFVAEGKLQALPRAERSRRGGAACAESREDKWSSRERSKLMHLWQSGLTANEVSSAMAGRSKLAVANELGKLRAAGLILRLAPEESKKRSKRIQAAHKNRRYQAALEIVRALPDTKSAGYIMGVLYGDGFITIQGDKGSLGLKSTNESFCAAFASALEETFSRKARLLTRIEPLKEIGGYTYENVRYFEAFLHSVHIGRAIREVFGWTDEKRWRADPEYFVRKGTQFVDGVIQGFFDAEGSFLRGKKGRYTTTACSMNGEGLKSIHALLKLRGYDASTNCDKRKQWRVSIGVQRDVRRFAAEIGSRIDYKAEKMRLCLADQTTGPRATELAGAWGQAFPL